MSSLAQLMDMGIPRGRAAAALKRSKDDVMAAAERVFAGEFDDIPSDDEDDMMNGLPTPMESDHGDTSDGLNQGVHDVDLSDEEVGYDEEDTGDNFDEAFLDDTHQCYMQDPYANVFFPKHRVEKLVEPIEKEQVATITTPGTSMRETVKVLGRGEWMSGCPEGAEQSFLFQIYSALTEGTVACSGGCGHRFRRAPEHFFALLPTFPEYAAHIASLIEQTCPKCRAVTCFACGERTVSTPSSTKGKAAAANNQIVECLFHCPNIQGVIIGVGLHMLEKACNPPEAVASGKRRKLAKVSAIGRKIGRLPAKGTGYSGNAHEDDSGQREAELNQTKTDDATAKLLSQLAVYLPNMKRSRTFTSDSMVHPTALAHLRRRSGFVNDLLRNNSLLDMTARNDIYCTLLDWLEIVANHEALAAMLAMPQMRPMATEPGPQADSVLVTYECRPSPRELLETLVIQAAATLRGLASSSPVGTPLSPMSAMPSAPPPSAAVSPPPATSPFFQTALEDDIESAQNAALKTFCERIVTARDNIDKHLANSRSKDFVARMHAELPSNKRLDRVKAAETEEATIKLYEDWARGAAFQYCDLTAPSGRDDKPAYRHAYSTSLQSLVGFEVPKRSRIIAKELGVLSTNMPTSWGSSIFLRIDDDRMDCIKAMIIGPKDTPYENGCFLFDIFLPLEYNQSCPSVKSMTTNGGLYRYNPNLYADGVCLSLLGTWSGPGWISGKSTLLQVLISIQSLILCEEPYINEPGWSNMGGSPASKAYSANVRRMVLHDAMANNLANPPYPFAEEIKTHFTLKADSIRAQLNAWKDLDDGKGTGSEGYRADVGTLKTFDAAADQVRTLLEKLSPPKANKAKAAPTPTVTRPPLPRKVKK